MQYFASKGKAEREHYPQNEDLKAARIQKHGILRGFKYPTKVVLDALSIFPNLIWSFDSNESWKEKVSSVRLRNRSISVSGRSNLL